MAVWSSLRRTVFSRQTLALASGGTAVAAGGGYWYLNSGPAFPATTLETRRPPAPWMPPSRDEMLASLRASSKNLSPDDEYDLLVVGGGATGAGVAVDAVSRGLKVALVERDDFSSGTSSKSTKLVHGGVRYLQKAVFEADYEQYKLVKEALHERKIFLQTAPYLSAMLPIMLPIYKYWQVPYYWVGCKMYDLLAGKENMESSYLMTKGRALDTFPMLKNEGLVGALVYYDGQHNDSRMNIALIMTAVKHGATVANYCEVTSLHKNPAGRLTGARVTDTLTGASWDVKAKGVINATGPFSDALLTLDNPAHAPIVQASSGIHITLPNYYSPRTMGMLDPSTSDGRVIFFLPWQGNTIAGTTDSKAAVTRDPKAQEEEIRWVLEEVRRYLSPDIKVRRGDVLSAWSGLRPLVKNPNAASTEGLVRNHMIHVGASGLLTIAGGKWTTYRAMAEETVDAAIKEFGLEGRVKNGCVTETLRLVGSDAWSRNMFIGLIQKYGLETPVAKHLSENYGDRAWTVCDYSLSNPTGETWPLHGTRLSAQYYYIEAEVRYAVHHEYAQTAVDVIARRTRLSFLNAHAALNALPRVVEIMGEELNWGLARKRAELEGAVRFLGSMGLAPGALVPTIRPSGVRERVENTFWWALGGAGIFGAQKPVGHTPRALFQTSEIDALRLLFAARAAVDGAVVKKLDSDKPGAVEYKLGMDHARELLKATPGYEAMHEKDWAYVLEEAGLGRRAEMDFEEFIEVCGGLKEVSIAPDFDHEKASKMSRRRIPVEESGGGL